MIGVFGGTGFVGGRFCEMFPNTTKIVDRNAREYDGNNILYLISTVHNYNNYSEDVETNELVLAQVLEKLRPDQTFNFVSSWFTIAQSIPQGNYSFSKRQAEEKVIWYCKRENIPYRIFRLANVFGSGDSYSPKKNALQYLIGELREGRDIELYWGGAFYRNYIHVDSVCNAISTIISKDVTINQIWNIGCRESVIFRDMIDMAYILMRPNAKIRKKADIPMLHQKVQTKDFYFDVSKTLAFVDLPTKEETYKSFIKMVLDEN